MQASSQYLLNRIAQVVFLISCLVQGSGAFAADQLVSPPWEGPSGGFVLRWTRSDITAFKTGEPTQPVFSAKDEIIKTLRRNNGSDFPYLSYQRFLRILSVVGPYVSLGDTEVYSNPGTYIAERFRVIDLRSQGRSIKLTDLFDEQDLVQALLADKVIKEAAGALLVKHRPNSLRSLTKALRSRASEPVQGKTYFPEDWLSRFAIHHTQGDRVAVRIAIPYMEGMREQKVRQVGVLLKPLKEFAVALHEVSSRRSGFLMKDVKTLSQEDQTLIEVKSLE